MINENDGHKAEILIIRRHSGEDHASHKGGAWKIAYADFVTAMMAFFLVMWLINSANEVTKSKVASYFNPIKMTDAAPAGKGLKDVAPNKKPENTSKSDTVGEKSGELTDIKGSGSADAAKTSAGMAKDEILQNPYKMIEQISSEGQAHPSGKTVDVVSEKTGDPFDPKAWEALREGKQNTDSPEADSNAGRNAAVATPPVQGDVSQQVADAAPNKVGKAPLQASGAGSAQMADKAASGQDAAAASAAKPLAGMSDVVSQAEKEIRAAIADAGAENDLHASVKTTSEGLLIVLSDASSNPMFAIGSAKPTPALIEVIDTVGKILATQDGRVVVRGHTDARRYKSLSFDNWQLSTARAHMASYILMHGGLDENKILKIEGYGSSEPLDAADPMADANRRVEFLLRK